jgi:hypothetical protein
MYVVPAWAQDLTGGQFTANCGNATAAQIFDANKMNTGLYGETNLIAVSDPDIVLIGNQWWMIFATGPSSTRAIQPFAAYLPPGASLSTTTTYPSDPNGWHLVGAQANGQGIAIPVSPNPGTNGWDQIAAETPSVDVGSDGTVSIYYSGHNAGQTPFQIGLMTGFTNGQATGDPNPVMTALEPWEFSSGLSALLEQSVRWMPQLNKYIMYYTAGAWWASPPDNKIAYAESTDGINWVNRQPLDFPVSYYNQDFLYNPARNRYEMVISNDPTGAGGANPRNIVWRDAATPAVKMANWQNEVTLLQYNASNSASWYNSGILSPSVKYGNLPGELNRMYVFFHSYSQAGDMSIGRFYCDAPAQSQTITFNSIPAQTVGSTLTVSATASSNLPVTFGVVPNGNCSVAGNTVTFLNAGACGVVANQVGNAAYQAAPSVGQVVQVNSQTAQTITFKPIPTQAAGTPLALSATATSGLAVSFASYTPGVCTVSGTTANFAGGGTCTIVASQTGNSTYAAAPLVTQSFTVSSGQQAQTITFNAIPAQTVGGSLVVSATASSGLPVTFSVVPNGNCSISGGTVTFLNVGNCGVVASQAGNASYLAAQAVGQIIVVNNSAVQSITFNAIPPQKVGGTLAITATASSGLPITYVIVPNGNCSISGSIVTFLNQGVCGVVATQGGNATYAPAAAVGQAIVVN